jgi:RNA polymerase sigma factor (sigma-70 family)
VHQFQRLAAPGAGGLSDSHLLERFVVDRNEAAFEVLVWRHGPLVYNVCRHLLRNVDDVEDAFQATFLALVRKATAIRNRGAVGAWLYQVAQRAALSLLAARRRAEPFPDAEIAAPADADDLLRQDLRAVVHDEVRRLPAKYRDAVILFYLSGLTTEEVARQLGCPRGTVLSRLAWARDRLRGRLTRRGVVLPAGALAVWLAQQGASASAPALLIGSTVRAGLWLAAGKAAAAGIVSARAALLMEGVLRPMFLTKLKTTVVVAVLAVLVAFGAGRWDQREATAQPAPRPQDEAAPVAPQGRTRVALLNMNYVIKNYDEYKVLHESVAKQVAFYEERHKASRARIEEWTRELADPNVGERTKEGLALDLRAERRKIEDDQAEAKRKISEMTDAQTVALYRKVQETADRWARAHDIDLVLQYNDVTPDHKDYFTPANVTRRMQAGGCTPLSWKPELDISKAVVAAMNANYRGPGK